MKNSYNFSEFDETIYSYFYINENICLPLRIDIADIKVYSNSYKFLKCKKEDNKIIIDKRDNPFKDDYEYYLLKQEIRKFLIHIDIKSKLFDNQNLLEYLKVKDLDELIDYLLEYLEVPIQTISNLKNELEFYIDILKGNFIDKVQKYLEINKNPKEFKPDLKGVNPKDFDTHFTQSYIKLQSMIEYHNSTPLFSENIGKAYSDWSWREIQTRLMFLTRKNQVSTEENRMQQAISDAILKDKSNQRQRM
jgi:hypothetical protein